MKKEKFEQKKNKIKNKSQKLRTRENDINGGAK